MGSFSAASLVPGSNDPPLITMIKVSSESLALVMHNLFMRNPFL